MHSQTPEFSILIGRVSTEDSDRILETLDALRAQRDGAPYEVVVEDRLADAVTQRILAHYPEARLERCDRSTTLPAMRARALARARGCFIVVTEDHCVPGPDWLASLSRALRENPDAAAIAGCVVNGVDTRALDWATFLCEYAAFSPPLQAGESNSLAGMNVVYRREALEGVPAAALVRGFWETTVHPLLAEAGLRLVQDPRVVIRHCKRFSLALFLRQRYVYSRYFGGIRFGRGQLGRRILATCGSLLIPPLMLWRLRAAVRAKPNLDRHARRALPALSLFYLVWAAGEAVGYLFGPGDALAEIE